LQFITMAELAAAAGMSIATLNRRDRAGDFPPSIRAGRCRLVERAAGLAWAEAQLRGLDE